jgi:hypothetical protein
MGPISLACTSAHDWAAEKHSALDAWAAHVLTIGEQGTPASKERDPHSRECPAACMGEAP